MVRDGDRLHGWTSFILGPSVILVADPAAHATAKPNLPLLGPIDLAGIASDWLCEDTPDEGDLSHTLPMADLLSNGSVASARSERLEDFDIDSGTSSVSGLAA